MRRVAIVSPYFPPSTLAGVHRARLLARHLPSHGWEPVVFCVHERHHDEPLDIALGELLPADLRIVRSGALPATACRALGFGDIGLRGYWHLRNELRDFLAREGADVVFITGSPFYPMLLARWLRRVYGVPVVLDFQDPWVSPSGASRRRLSKAGMSHALATLLEPKALDAADHVVAVSERQNQDLMARHPWWRTTPMSAIPIGGDPLDFEVARKADPTRAESILAPGMVNFSYVGTYWERAEPVFRALLLAAAHVQRTQPQLAARLRFNFVGTTAQPGGLGRPRLADLVRETGTADLVREVPERIPYLRAIAVMAKSEVLMLLGSDEPHFTASKIYPALLSGRPSLAIYHRASSSCRVLDAAGGARMVRFDSAEDLANRVHEIAAAIERLATDPGSTRPVAPEAIAEYCADRIAGRFAAIFDGLAKSPPRKRQ